jgi:hypothetical protein
VAICGLPKCCSFLPADGVHGMLQTLGQTRLVAGQGLSRVRSAFAKVSENVWQHPAVGIAARETNPVRHR